ncbi:GvpL/GvpF family gas vesicle protein [Streptomyces avidinii]
MPASRAVRGCRQRAHLSLTDFLNLSLLVHDEHKEALRTAEVDLAREIGNDVDLRFSGPLPPYSFVQ